MRWRKAAAVFLVLGSTASCSALEVAEDVERREARDPPKVDSGRVRVTLVATDETLEIPKFLDIEFDMEIADGGELVAMDVEVGDQRGSNPRGPELEFILEERSQVYVRVHAGPKKLRQKWTLLSLEEFEEQLPAFQGVVKFANADKLLNADTSLLTEEVVGDETVDGVETTMYESLVSVEEMQDAIALPDDLVRKMESATGGEMRFTAWVDDDGFVRRLAFPIKGSYLAPRRLGEEELVFRFDIRDHGEDVEIELPDQDDVVRF